MDLMELYHLKMSRCAIEQFWAMTAYSAMCLFLIKASQEELEPFRNKLTLVVIGLAGMLFTVYIYSRHKIYMTYDPLLNQLMDLMATEKDLPPPPIAGRGKALVMLSGVSFYIAIIITIGVAAFLAVLSKLKKADVGGKQSE